MSKFRMYLLGLALLFVGFVAVEYFRPTPTNWSPTFINRDRIPYGTYVLYDLLPSLFPGQLVRTIRQPIANQLLPELGHDVLPDSGLTEKSPKLLTQQANYLFVDNSFTCSRLDGETLLRYVARGNTAFIAAEYFDEQLADTLRFHMETATDIDSILARQERTAPTRQTLVQLANPGFAKRRFSFPETEVEWFFQADSACRATALATDAQRRPLLVRVPFGQGFFYLSSTPKLFSNVALLRPGAADYAFASLSYLPARPVFWDEYQKQGPLGEQSLLRVLKEHLALRTAGWLLLVGAVLFLVFEAKRRQRIIPIVKPLPNTTLLFTRNVASLYRQGRDHHAIAAQKTELFLEYLRTRFHEKTDHLDDEAFLERLAQKSGVAREQVNELMRQLNFTRTAPRIDDHQLLHLSELMRRFRRTAR